MQVCGRRVCCRHLSPGAGAVGFLPYRGGLENVNHQVKSHLMSESSRTGLDQSRQINMLDPV